ncbi:MAG TPA: hypothetical protein DCM86_02545 [Verrucomicrobiales bacterium]|nr:hypothetical protein [Verrucomicrobiales bacterium]
MSLAGQRSRIVGLTRELASHWERTRESWRDAQAQEFERKYLEEIHSGVSAAIAAMDQIDKQISKLRNDCG